METLALGDLITAFYTEYLALYGDEDLAAVATAATVDKIVHGTPLDVELDEAEEAAA
jgi:hypothetical protein